MQPPSRRIYNPAVLNTEFVIRLRFAFKMLILTAAGLQIRQDGHESGKKNDRINEFQKHHDYFDFAPSPMPCKGKIISTGQRPVIGETRYSKP